MSDAGAGALLLLGLLLFAAAYSWLKSQGDRPDEGWLPREIADGELAFAEKRFESKRLGLVARLDRAYRQGGELHLVELKTRGYFAAHASDARELQPLIRLVGPQGIGRPAKGEDLLRRVAHQHQPAALAPHDVVGAQVEVLGLVHGHQILASQLRLVHLE